MSNQALVHANLIETSTVVCKHTKDMHSISQMQPTLLRIFYLPDAFDGIRTMSGRVCVCVFECFIFKFSGKLRLFFQRQKSVHLLCCIHTYIFYEFKILMNTEYSRSLRKAMNKAHSERKRERETHTGENNGKHYNLCQHLL